MRWAFFSGRKSTDEVIKDKKPCGHTVFRKRIDLFDNPTSEYENGDGISILIYNSGGLSNNSNEQHNQERWTTPSRRNLPPRSTRSARTSIAPT